MQFDQTFDFIVIGGGTAGLVVAARLSENPGVQVLVVEAGSDHRGDPAVRVPGRWFTLLGGELDWNFTSTEQEHLKGRKIGQPQGRVLGGSSAINGQAFIPPSAAVVNAWGDLGNPGWSWETLSPYWRKSHTLNIPSTTEHRNHLGLDYIDDEARGQSGPLKAYYATPLSEPLAPAWSETFKELGFAPSTDPSSGETVGGFSSAATIDADTKERSYSATAHWEDASSRSNLHLYMETFVNKILLSDDVDEDEPTAIGVEVVQNGKDRCIRATQEVILAAGAFQSPKLLELSGIGNGEHLMKHGVKPRTLNPGVGENLQDHLMTGISFEVKEGVRTLDDLRKKDTVATNAAAEAYAQRKEGPLTLGGINFFSWMPLVPVAKNEISGKIKPFEAMLRLHPSAIDAKDNRGLQLQYNYLRDLMLSEDQASGGVYLSPRGTTYGASPSAKDYGVSSLPGQYITIGLSLLQPFSRGSVHLSSPDPREPPRINPCYLSNPLDVEVAAAHLSFIETLASTQPLAGFLKPNGRRNADGAQGRDPAVAREWIRRSVLSNWHPCGTCSMMPRSMGGVVSPRLSVYGVRSLRVVDASIMPIIPRGNIQSSVYMVAERAADIIKEDCVLQTQTP